MPHFGPRSRNRIATLDPRWRPTLDDAIVVVDFAVLCGYRDEVTQTEAYATGASRKRWPESVHNVRPSLAVDVAPWPIDWKDSLAFAHLAGVLRAMAQRHGHALRWGGDWDSDGSSTDQSFMDLGHFELRPHAGDW